MPNVDVVKIIIVVALIAAVAAGLAAAFGTVEDGASLGGAAADALAMKATSPGGGQYYSPLWVVTDLAFQCLPVGWTFGTLAGVFGAVAGIAVAVLGIRLLIKVLGG